MPNTAFDRKFQRRFLRCDALSGKAASAASLCQTQKFFCRTILLSLCIFPVFFTRAPLSRPPEPLAKQLPPLFRPAFCLPPNDRKQQSCSRCCVDFRQSERFAQVARFHHGASIAARTDFPFGIRLPTGSTVQNPILTRFVFYSSPQVTARARGRRFIHSEKHDTCCCKFYLRHCRSDRYEQRQCKG